MSRPGAYILLVVLLCLCADIFAQNNTEQVQQINNDSLPYQKDPSLPALILYDKDSLEYNTFFIKEGRPSVLIFFSTDCEHCQMLAQELAENMKELHGADFYLLSPMPLRSINEFAEKYITGTHRNVHFYKEPNHLFSRYYGVSYVPFIAVYDKHKKLMKTFEGSLKIADLVALLNKK